MVEPNLVADYKDINLKKGERVNTQDVTYILKGQRFRTAAVLPSLHQKVFSRNECQEEGDEVALTTASPVPTATTTIA